MSDQRVVITGTDMERVWVLAAALHAQGERLNEALSKAAVSYYSLTRSVDAPGVLQTRSEGYLLTASPDFRATLRRTEEGQLEICIEWESNPESE